MKPSNLKKFLSVLSIHQTSCLLIFLLFPFVLHAQDLSPEKIRIYTTHDGMLDDYICCMDQDKDGNLWIGTGSGATKFDGKSFRNYGAKDGFSNKQIWAILCDSKGYIWFGTQRDGLFRFDGEKWERFTKEKEGLSSNNFFEGCLYEDRQGNIWGGGMSQNVFKYSNGKFDFFDFRGTGITEDQQGNLYISGDRDKSIHKYTKSKNSFEIIYNQFDRATDIAIGQNDNMWVADNNYIAKSTDFGKTFTKFKYDQDKIGQVSACWDMFIDNNNHIWTGNDDYVVRFDGSKFYYYNQGNGLPASDFYYVFQDKQGHLWFCSAYGLAKFDNIPPKLEFAEQIPDKVKSDTFSFKFNGDDGKFGSP